MYGRIDNTLYCSLLDTKIFIEPGTANYKHWTIEALSIDTTEHDTDIVTGQKTMWT